MRWEGGTRRTMGEGTVVIGLDAVTDPEGMTTWPSSSSLPLGALVTATPCARLHTRAMLAEWGLNDLAEAAELIVSELVTNAVRASTGPDGHPRYDGSGLPVVVEAMCQRWSWETVPGWPGKVVWAELHVQ